MNGLTNIDRSLERAKDIDFFSFSLPLVGVNKGFLGKYALT
jgi:hypothetical protein